MATGIYEKTADKEYMTDLAALLEQIPQQSLPLNEANDRALRKLYTRSWREAKTSAEGTFDLRQKTSLIRICRACYRFLLTEGSCSKVPDSAVLEMLSLAENFPLPILGMNNHTKYGLSSPQAILRLTCG